MLVALVSAVLYVLGSLEGWQKANDRGVPTDYLADVSVQETAVKGFGDLLLLTAIVLLALAVLILLGSPFRLHEKLRTLMRSWYERHPIFYMVFGVFVILAAFQIAGVGLPILRQTVLHRLPSWWAELYGRPMDDSLRVLDVQLKEGGSLLKEKGELRFVARRNGFLTLQRGRDREFVIISEANLLSLVLRQERLQ